MMGGMDGWGGYYGSMGGAINVLFLVGLLALVAWLVVRVLPNQRSGNGFPGARADSAQEILRARFARGEIDAGEYERSLNVLRGEPGYGSYEDYVREARERITRESPRRGGV